jgi:hypothetical protein
MYTYLEKICGKSQRKPAVVLIMLPLLKSIVMAFFGRLLPARRRFGNAGDCLAAIHAFETMKPSFEVASRAWHMTPFNCLCAPVVTYTHREIVPLAPEWHGHGMSSTSMGDGGGDDAPVRFVHKVILRTLGAGGSLAALNAEMTWAQVDAMTNGTLTRAAAEAAAQDRHWSVRVTVARDESLPPDYLWVPGSTLAGLPFSLTRLGTFLYNALGCYGFIVTPLIRRTPTFMRQSVFTFRRRGSAGDFGAGIVGASVLTGGGAGSVAGIPKLIHIAPTAAPDAALKAGLPSTSQPLSSTSQPQSSTLSSLQEKQQQQQQPPPPPPSPPPLQPSAATSTVAGTPRAPPMPGALHAAVRKQDVAAVILLCSHDSTGAVSASKDAAGRTPLIAAAQREDLVDHAENPAATVLDTLLVMGPAEALTHRSGQYGDTVLLDAVRHNRCDALAVILRCPLVTPAVVAMRSGAPPHDTVLHHAARLEGAPPAALRVLLSSRKVTDIDAVNDNGETALDIYSATHSESETLVTFGAFNEALAANALRGEEENDDAAGAGDDGHPVIGGSGGEQFLVGGRGGGKDGGTDSDGDSDNDNSDAGSMDSMPAAVATLQHSILPSGANAHALWTAVRDDNTAAVSRLLTSDDPQITLACGPDGWSALATAIEGSGDGMVTLVVCRCPEPLLAVTSGPESLTPLHIAARNGSVHAAETLLTGAAGRRHFSTESMETLVNARTANTRDTALHVAAREGSTGVARLILGCPWIRTARSRNKAGLSPADIMGPSMRRDLADVLPGPAEVDDDDDEIDNIAPNSTGNSNSIKNNNNNTTTTTDGDDNNDKNNNNVNGSGDGGDDEPLSATMRATRTTASSGGRAMRRGQNLASSMGSMKNVARAALMFSSKSSSSSLASTFSSSSLSSSSLNGGMANGGDAPKLATILAASAFLSSRSSDPAAAGASSSAATPASANSPWTIPPSSSASSKPDTPSPAEVRAGILREIHEAVRADRPSVVHTLLATLPGPDEVDTAALQSRGGDPLRHPATGLPAACAAATLRHADALKIILGHPTLDPMACDARGRSMLHLAVRSGARECIDEIANIVRSGGDGGSVDPSRRPAESLVASLRSLGTAQDELGCTALHVAAVRPETPRDTAILEKLVGVWPEALKVRNNRSNVPWETSRAVGLKKRVRWLRKISTGK